MLLQMSYFDCAIHQVLSIKLIIYVLLVSFEQILIPALKRSFSLDWSDQMCTSAFSYRGFHYWPRSINSCTAYWLYGSILHFYPDFYPPSFHSHSAITYWTVRTTALIFYSALFSIRSTSLSSFTACLSKNETGR